MRHIDFEPDELQGEQLTWFDRWRTRAGEVEAELLTLPPGERGPYFESNSSVWSELKTWLLSNVFAGKCAYCEDEYFSSSYGDAEHYRPKGRVTEPGQGRRVVPTAPTGAKHGGYYWLAFTWWNLIPACQKCNSGGKSDLFPIENTRVFDMSELEDASTRDELNTIESPLLLHPYDDEPTEHLVFGAQGVVSARNGSARGQASIDTCKLNREELAGKRWKRQKAAITAAKMVYIRRHSGDCPIDWGPVRQEFIESGNEFSAAALDAIRDYNEEVRREAMSLDYEP